MRTATPLQLDRRARHGTKRAEHAAIAGFWTQHGVTRSAFVKELASIGRHRFFFNLATVWTGDNRFKNDFHGI
jgi:hypothetical protein